LVKVQQWQQRDLVVAEDQIDVEVEERSWGSTSLMYIDSPHWYVLEIFIENYLMPLLFLTD
jgi:hypothetical protein